MVKKKNFKRSIIYTLNPNILYVITYNMANEQYGFNNGATVPQQSWWSRGKHNTNNVIIY